LFEEVFVDLLRTIPQNRSFSIFHQVFEANIRLLGGLLSAHLLMEEKGGPFQEYVPDW
jgi:hypothetical protein